MRSTTKRTLMIVAAVLIVTPMIASTAVQASDPFLAEIIMFGGNFAPRGWAFCDGQLLSIASYSAVFSLVGTTYGGDGRTTFGLPDLRGRVAVHPGSGPGLSPVTWGQRGGLQNVTLNINNMPSHTHTATGVLHATDTAGNQSGPAGHLLAQDPREDQYSDAAAPNVTMKAGAVTVTNSNTGEGQAFDNRQPYLGVYHIFALQGVFPSRN